MISKQSEKWNAVCLVSLTLEHPGVKAPGTAKMMTFLPAHRSAMFTLLAGESSNKSMFGTLSPSCWMPLLLLLLGTKEKCAVSFHYVICRWQMIMCFKSKFPSHVFRLNGCRNTFFIENFLSKKRFSSEKGPPKKIVKSVKQNGFLTRNKTSTAHTKSPAKKNSTLEKSIFRKNSTTIFPQSRKRKKIKMNFPVCSP